ncbi:MAG: hypothetical protein KatS3mg105_2056 [Gemmatales bacterium]|nr:MAG: hypothetical protein KatS3mg105_2056 [Gemmatales bacterium]
MDERSCGECTACCTILGIEELGKPFYSTCKHVCDRGCSIYSKRPSVCRDYRCLWLARFLPKKNCRPDILGVMFDWEEDDTLEVYEVRPGGFAGQRVQRLIDKLFRSMKAKRVVYYPYRCLIGIDYPISSDYPDHNEYGKERRLIPLDMAGRRFENAGLVHES